MGVKKAPVEAGTLATQLEGLHKMAAVLLSRPYLEISPTESKQLATALSNIAKQYKIEVNPAIMAWISFGMCAAGIYGPRIGIEVAARKQAMAMERERRRLTTAGSEASQSMTVQPGSGTMTFQ